VRPTFERIAEGKEKTTMRVVITGATGNVGTSLLDSLAAEPAVDSIVGIARRSPKNIVFPKVEWREADVCFSDLCRIFAGADAVVHLAWVIQPSHDRKLLRRINVEGSRRVFSAVAESGVSNLIYASSVGTYSPGPKDRAVDESWPNKGIRTSDYSTDKAAVEEMLDDFEAANPSTRVVRLRPALIFKREAASGIRRLFAGPFLPSVLLRRYLIPIIPMSRQLRFQAVHSREVGDAYRRAIVGDTRGPFNIAADPVLDVDRIAALLRAKPFPVSPGLVKVAADTTWRLHLQPTNRGWLDMGLQVPIMDWSRARTVLGWQPRFSSEDALMELIAGIRDSAGIDTPPLSPRTSGPVRVRELLTGVGQRT
jgi:UDP-glucose 4-epimerase